MNNIILIYVGFLSVDYFWTTSGFSLYNEVGASTVVDPAPGRSPGPPDIQESLNEVIKIGDQIANDCELNGTFKNESEDVGLTFSISHPLFSVEELVPELTYQGMFVGSKLNLSF